MRDTTLHLNFGEHLLILLAAAAISVLTIFGVVALNGTGRKKAQPPGQKAVEITVIPREIKPVKHEETKIHTETRNGLHPLPAPPSVLPNSASLITLELPASSVAAPTFEPEDLRGDLDDIILTEEAVDRKPEIISSVLIYPERARARHIEGRVTLSLLINKDGSVERAVILQAEPEGMFEASVLEAVNSWKFRPARYGDNPVGVWVKMPVEFKLE